MSINPKSLQNLKHWTKEYQSPNRGRKPTKFLTELLTKELKSKKDIEIEGFDVNTGEKTRIRVPAPTKEIIVQALLRQAAKGNMVAIKEVFDRTEGKSLQPVGLQDHDGNSVPLQIVFQEAPGCEPIKDSE
jgi:hypothetical protein